MRFLPQLKNFYSGEKDAVQKQIDEAYAKFSGQGAPVPTRGPAIRAASSKAQDEEGTFDKFTCFFFIFVK